MMTIFFKEEMTLKMTLLMWKPMATFNALISCVTSSDERFWPLMTSIRTNVFTFTKANLYYYINFLLMKHVNALESKCLHYHGLITFDSDWYQKTCARFKNSMGPFALRDASISDLVVPIEIGRVHFLSLLIGVGNRGGTCCMLTMFLQTFTSNMI